MADDQKQIATPAQDEQSGMSLTRIAMIVAGVLVAVVAGVVIIAILLAQGDVERVAPIMQIFRDIFIIFLALQGVLIIIALTVLIVQLARLINLLQNEVQPILKNTQETVKTASGTMRFVSSNVTQPIVRAGAFMAGLGVLVSNLGGLRRALEPIEVPDERERTEGS